MNTKTPGVTLSAREQRAADLDHLEKLLLHILRNPATSTVSRQWERDIKARARSFGYRFEYQQFDNEPICGNLNYE